MKTTTESQSNIAVLDALPTAEIIRKRVSYKKLVKSMKEGKTLEELKNTVEFLDTNLMFGSERAANYYKESLKQLIKDCESKIFKVRISFPTFNATAEAKSEEEAEEMARGMLSEETNIFDESIAEIEEVD